MQLLTLAGAGLSAYSTIQGGKEAAETGELKLQLNEGEALAGVQSGMDKARFKREEGRRLMASLIAKPGRMVGSKLVVMAENVRNVEADALMIELNAQTRAKALRMRGAFAKYEGEMARKNARIRAAANMLNTAGTLYGMYKYSQPKTTWNQQKAAMADPYYYEK